MSKHVSYKKLHLKNEKGDDVVIHESDPNYIWYLEEPCKILISEVKIISKENIIVQKDGLIKIKSE